MKRMSYIALVFFPLLLLLGGSNAWAIGETASLNFRALPLKGKFQKDQSKPTRLSWGVDVQPAEGQPTILPMRVADMKFPRALQFVPRRGLRACNLSEPLLVGPAEVIYSRCPDSVVGNGQASFQLGQSVSPLAFRKGTVVVLYGGRVDGNVRLRFAAWSGDTNAGVVAEGVLLRTGRMEVRLPVLTADSAITSLQLSIPGKKVAGTWASGNPYSLRAGSDPAFARVRCRMGQRLSFSAKLLLGARNQLGYPYGPETRLEPSASARCGR